MTYSRHRARCTAVGPSSGCRSAKARKASSASAAQLPPQPHAVALALQSS